MTDLVVESPTVTNLVIESPKKNGPGGPFGDENVESVNTAADDVLRNLFCVFKSHAVIAAIYLISG